MLLTSIAVCILDVAPLHSMVASGSPPIAETISPAISLQSFELTLTVKSAPNFLAVVKRRSTIS